METKVEPVHLVWSGKEDHHRIYFHYREGDSSKQDLSNPDHIINEGKFSKEAEAEGHRVLSGIKNTSNVHLLTVTSSKQLLNASFALLTLHYFTAWDAAFLSDEINEFFLKVEAIIDSTTRMMQRVLVLEDATSNLDLWMQLHMKNVAELHIFCDHPKHHKIKNWVYFFPLKYRVDNLLTGGHDYATLCNSTTPMVLSLQKQNMPLVLEAKERKQLELPGESFLNSTSQYSMPGESFLNSMSQYSTAANEAFADQAIELVLFYNNNNKKTDIGGIVRVRHTPYCMQDKVKVGTMNSHLNFDVYTFLPCKRTHDAILKNTCELNHLDTSQAGYFISRNQFVALNQVVLMPDSEEVVGQPRLPKLGCVRGIELDCEATGGPVANLHLGSFDGSSFQQSPLSGSDAHVFVVHLNETPDQTFLTRILEPWPCIPTAESDIPSTSPIPRENDTSTTEHPREKEQELDPYIEEIKQKMKDRFDIDGLIKEMAREVNNRLVETSQVSRQEYIESKRPEAIRVTEEDESPVFLIRNFLDEETFEGLYLLMQQQQWDQNISKVQGLNNATPKEDNSVRFSHSVTFLLHHTIDEKVTVLKEHNEHRCFGTGYLTSLATQCKALVGADADAGCEPIQGLTYPETGHFKAHSDAGNWDMKEANDSTVTVGKDDNLRYATCLIYMTDILPEHESGGRTIFPFLKGAEHFHNDLRPWDNTTGHQLAVTPERNACLLFFNLNPPDEIKNLDTVANPRMVHLAEPLQAKQKHEKPFKAAMNVWLTLNPTAGSIQTRRDNALIMAKKNNQYTRKPENLFSSEFETHKKPKKSEGMDVQDDPKRVNNVRKLINERKQIDRLKTALSCLLQLIDQANNQKDSSSSSEDGSSSSEDSSSEDERADQISQQGSAIEENGFDSRLAKYRYHNLLLGILPGFAHMLKEETENADAPTVYVDMWNKISKKIVEIYYPLFGTYWSEYLYNSDVPQVTSTADGKENLRLKKLPVSMQDTETKNILSSWDTDADLTIENLFLIIGNPRLEDSDSAQKQLDFTDETGRQLADELYTGVKQTLTETIALLNTTLPDIINRLTLEKLRLLRETGSSYEQFVKSEERSVQLNSTFSVLSDAVQNVLNGTASIYSVNWLSVPKVLLNKLTQAVAELPPESKVKDELSAITQEYKTDITNALETMDDIAECIHDNQESNIKGRLLELGIPETLPGDFSGTESLRNKAFEKWHREPTFGWTPTHLWDPVASAKFQQKYRDYLNFKFLNKNPCLMTKVKPIVLKLRQKINRLFFE